MMLDISFIHVLYKDLLLTIHATKAVFTTNDLKTELQNGIFNPNKEEEDGYREKSG